MHDYSARATLATKFHLALVSRNWESLRDLIADDAVWILPGNNAISDTAVGVDAVVARARKIAEYGLNFALKNILLSRTDVALGLHNTAERSGVQLDEHLTTVLRIRDGQIHSIETFLSDVDRMNRFFR